MGWGPPVVLHLSILLVLLDKTVDSSPIGNLHTHWLSHRQTDRQTGRQTGGQTDKGQTRRNLFVVVSLKLALSSCDSVDSARLD